MLWEHGQTLFYWKIGKLFQFCHLGLRPEVTKMLHRPLMAFLKNIQLVGKNELLENLPAED